jgi:hypothetical protein|tara:strand:+ start:836 stop:1114 length:279 start_codon:yes stop_codon:yes gene_type:complete
MEETELNKINKLYNEGEITREEANKMREALEKNLKISIPSEATDRELAERQFKSIKQLESNTSTIKMWVNFWSIISIVGFVVWLLILIGVLS